MHAIFPVSEIGVSSNLPLLKEIVRSVGSPYIDVNFFQSSLTSVSITAATLFTSPAGAAAPVQVTATTSTTRSSTAKAGASPNETKAKSIAVSIERRLRMVSILNLPRSIFMSINPE